jgi:hypothetical protein
MLLSTIIYYYYYYYYYYYFVVVKTGSEAHTASYPTGIRVSFLGGKAAEA